MNWDQFFVPYEQTVTELKVKLRGLREQYEQDGKNCPSGRRAGRVNRRAFSEEKNCTTPPGWNHAWRRFTRYCRRRVMTKYMEDVYRVDLDYCGNALIFKS